MPFPEKRVAISLEREPESWVHFLMEVNWCRFIRAGWYVSGGKFVKVIDWPADTIDLAKTDCM